MKNEHVVVRVAANCRILHRIHLWLLCAAILCAALPGAASSAEVDPAPIGAGEMPEADKAALAEARDAFQQAHSWILLIEDEEQRDDALRRLATSAVAADISLSLKCIDAMSVEEKKYRTLQYVFKIWAEREPDAALMRSLDFEEPLKSWAIAGVVMGLNDTRLARDLAGTIDDSRPQANALSHLVVKAVKTNPAEAVEIYRDIPRPHDETLGTYIIARIAEKDLESALEVFGKLRTENVRAVSVGSLVEAYLDKKDVETAFDLAINCPLACRDFVLVYMIAGASTLDAQLVLKIPSEVNDGNYRELAYFQVAASLHDDEKLLAELAGGASEQEKLWIQAGILAGSVKSGKISLPLEPPLAGTRAGDAALTMIASECQTRGLNGSAFDAAGAISDPGLRDRCMAAIAMNVAESNPLIALHICQKISQRIYSSTPMARVAITLTASNPTAAEWLNSEFARMAAISETPPTQLDLGCRNIVIADWSEFDPAAAAEFAIHYPTRDSDLALFDGIAENWARIDFKAANAWGTQLARPIDASYFFTGLGRGRYGNPHESPFDYATTTISFDFLMDWAQQPE